MAGDITKIIPAQAVRVYRGSDQLNLTDDVIFRGTHTRNITNTRAGPIYTFQWRTREIEIKAALTEDLLTQIETDNALDANSAMSFNNWRINGLSISGTPGDNTDDTYSAAVIDYEELAPENGTSEIRIRLLVSGTAT